MCRIMVLGTYKIEQYFYKPYLFLIILVIHESYLPGIETRSSFLNISRAFSTESNFLMLCNSVTSPHT